MIDIRWDDRFTVGNERIDNEHKVFIDMVRKFSDTVEGGKPLDLVERRLEELGRYAEFHFFSEEALMIETDYPELESHRSEHQQLLEDFMARVAEYRQDPTTGEDLVMFLFEWFILHTTSVDTKLAQHLQPDH